MMKDEIKKKNIIYKCNEGGVFLAYHSPFTTEEIEADKEDILEMLKQGIPYRVICEELGRAKSYVESVKKKLIENGDLLVEELEKARKEYKRQNPTAQGINKTKIYKRKVTGKAKKQNLKKERNKEKIAELFKKGYIQSEIARELGLSDSAINYYKKELIKEGKLKIEEIKKTTNVRHDRISEYKDLIPQVVELIKNGESSYSIRDKMGLNSNAYAAIAEHIKKHKLIEKEELDNIKNQKELKEMNLIEREIKSGKSLNKILEENPSISNRKIKKIIKDLDNRGIITRELIEENKQKEINKSKNKGNIMSIEEQNSFVLQNLRKGLTPSEIVEKDQTNSLTVDKVSIIKRKLIEDGKVSKKTLNKAIKKHNEKKLSEKYDKEIIFIKQHIEMGYPKYKIAEMIGHSQSYVSNRIREYSETNSWYSSDEIKKFRKQKRERELERKIKINKWMERRKELERQMIERNLKKKNNKEEEFDKKYEKLKIEAVIGYEKYILGNKRIGKGIREFLDLLLLMEEKGIEIDQQGIKFAGKLIAECKEVTNKEYLKFIILKYNKIFGEQAAIGYINTVIREQEDGIYNEGLEKFKITLSKIRLKKSIQELKEQGLTNNDIAKNLNISYDEVLNLYRNDINTDIEER